MNEKRLGRLWYLSVLAVLLAVLSGACKAAPAPTPTKAAPTPTTAAPTPTRVVAAPTPTVAPSAALIQIPKDIQDEMPLLAKYHWSQVEWSKPTITGQGKTSGGKLQLRQPSNPPTWDLASPTAVLTANFGGAWMNRLVAPDMNLALAFEGKGNIHKLFLRGDLAESWDISDGGKTYTFKIRQGVRWHNVPPTNGREFTSEDALYNINRFRDPKLSGATADIYKEVVSVEAPDKYTLVVKTNASNAGFLYSISAATNLMVPKEAVDDGTLKSRAVGTGPFIMKEYLQNNRTSGEKNPEYFRKGKPYVDKIDWFDIPDAASIIAAYRTGKTDEYTYLGWPNAKSILANPGVYPTLLYVNEQNSLTCAHIGFRMTDKPFDDEKVRKAMSMAIDYKASIQALFEGNGRIGFCGVPTDWDGGRLFPRTSKDAPEHYQYNPEKAKALLKDAGYPAGSLKMKMTVQRTGEGGLGPDAALFSEYWKAIGIEIEPVLADATTWRTRNYTGTWDPGGFYYGFNFTGGSDLNDWTDLVETGAAANRYKVSDPVLDQLVEKQKRELDRVKREQIGKQIADYIYEHNVGRIWLPSPLFFHFFRPWVQGFVGHDLYFWAANFGQVVLEDVWIDRSRMPAGVDR